MKDNKKFFKRFVSKHKGELVLDCFDVVRLDGFAEDDIDYYYICTGRRGEEWISCVGALYPLKGILPEKQYERLLKVFNLNVKFWLDTAKKTK
jgi:hypothetical protein